MRKQFPMWGMAVVAVLGFAAIIGIIHFRLIPITETLAVELNSARIRYETSIFGLRIRTAVHGIAGDPAVLAEYQSAKRLSRLYLQYAGEWSGKEEWVPVETATRWRGRESKRTTEYSRMLYAPEGVFTIAEGTLKQQGGAHGISKEAAGQFILKWLEVLRKGGDKLTAQNYLLATVDKLSQLDRRIETTDLIDVDEFLAEN